MANPEWLEIFRSYSDAELAEKVAQLKKQDGVLSSASVGSKNYTKDLASLRGQLAAAIRIQGERAGRGAPVSGVVDFSKLL